MMSSLLISGGKLSMNCLKTPNCETFGAEFVGLKEKLNTVNLPQPGNNLDSRFDTFLSNEIKKQGTHSNRLIPYIMRYAAAAVIVLIASVFIIKNSNTKDEPITLDTNYC